MILVILFWILVIVPLAGGNLHRLLEARLANQGLLLIVYVLQAFARSRFGHVYLLGPWSVLAWSCLSGVLVVLLWRSKNVCGVSIMILGVVLNMLVVLLNGAMPVALQSWIEVSPKDFYRIASAGDSLLLFGDVLPFGEYSLVSLGDLLLVVGVAAFVLSSSMGQSCRRGWRMLVCLGGR